MVQRTVDEFGRVDILVNNAGGTRMGPLTGLTTRGWDAAFDLNVRAAYFCTREAGRHLVAQRSGAIVNVSSGAGLNGVKGGAHYASAKAALQMFTKVTAAEWGPYGIRTNCVAVGLVASERAVEAWKVARIDPEAASADEPFTAAREARRGRGSHRVLRQRRGLVHQRPDSRRRWRSLDGRHPRYLIPGT